MGILQRLFERNRPASPGRDPREGLLARFPEGVVAESPDDAELARAFPSIPPEHLRVLVAFMRAGARETGAHLEGDQWRRALELTCAMYQAGRLEVKRAGSEWQLWQRGELPRL